MSENQSEGGSVLQSSVAKEGELPQKRNFTDTEMLDYLERHHTLHKKIDFLYVVDGYEAVVTSDDEPISPTYKGSSLRNALNELMQSGDVLTSNGR